MLNNFAFDQIHSQGTVFLVGYEVLTAVVMNISIFWDSVRVVPIRNDIPLKRRFKYELHGTISLNMATLFLWTIVW
jgi:hypothetical protein